MIPGILDCSSVDTAAHSLAELLGLSLADLQTKMETFEIDWDHERTPPEDQVLIQLGANPHSPPEPRAIRWFHATRVLPGTTFEEGLLPTVAVLPKMWEALGACAAEWLTTNQWNDYQDSFLRGDRQFSRQFRNKREEGPFAFLVRDAAIGKHGAHQNFTRMCETFDDICADFELVHGHSLKEAYEKRTRSCLVVFTWPGARVGAVKAAANYVFRTSRNIECGLPCNSNFCGKGKLVPRALIDSVEWL